MYYLSFESQRSSMYSVCVWIKLWNLYSLLFDDGFYSHSNAEERCEQLIINVEAVEKRSWKWNKIL